MFLSCFFRDQIDAFPYALFRRNNCYYELFFSKIVDRGLFFFVTIDLKKLSIFWYGNENCGAQFDLKMPKNPCFSLFRCSPRDAAWRISWPHISTPENLHAKANSVFSVRLRGFTRFFLWLTKLCGFFDKKLET